MCVWVCVGVCVGVGVCLVWHIVEALLHMRKQSLRSVAGPIDSVTQFVGRVRLQPVCKMETTAAIFPL